MQSKDSCHVVQRRGTAKRAGKQQVRGSNPLSWESCLKRATEGEGQSRIRSRTYSDLYLRVFYSSDTDNKFSTRWGLTSLLSWARMKINKWGLKQKIATWQRFIRGILQRKPAGMGLSHAEGMTTGLVCLSHARIRIPSSGERNPQQLHILKQVPREVSAEEHCNCLLSLRAIHFYLSF